MDKNILIETATKMMERPKGILAMDESSPTIAKRLASINVDIMRIIEDVTENLLLLHLIYQTS